MKKKYEFLSVYFVSRQISSLLVRFGEKPQFFLFFYFLSLSHNPIGPIRFEWGQNVTLCAGRAGAGGWENIFWGELFYVRAYLE